MGKKLRTAALYVGLVAGVMLGGYHLGKQNVTYPNPVSTSGVNEKCPETVCPKPINPDFTYSNSDFTITYTLQDKNLVNDCGREDFNSLIEMKGLDIHSYLLHPDLRGEFADIDVATFIKKTLLIKKKLQNLEELLPKDGKEI